MDTRQMRTVYMVAWFFFLGVMAPNLPVIAAGPCARISLNKESARLSSENWLNLFTQTSGIPVMLAGPLSGRGINYTFGEERAGDILDELCQYFGYGMQMDQGIAILTHTSQSRGLPPALDSWVDTRCKANNIPAVTEELLRLSVYSDDIISEIERRWEGVSRLVRYPAPYRFYSSLSPEQIKKINGSGLNINGLTKSQMQMLLACTKGLGIFQDLPPDSLIQTLNMMQADKNVPLVQQSYPQAGNDLCLIYRSDGVQYRRSLLHFRATLNSTSLPLPPLPEQTRVSEVLEITSTDKKISGHTVNSSLAHLLNAISQATGDTYTAEAALQSISISFWGSEVNTAAFLDSIASSVEGKWELLPSGGYIIKARNKSQVIKQETDTPGGLLKRLFWAVDQSPADRKVIGACDFPLYTEIDSINWRYWGIKLLSIADPNAPSHAEEPGEMHISSQMLPEEALQCLMHLSQRLLDHNTHQPLYTREVLLDPDTDIKINWDGKGNYRLAIHNPRFGQDVLDSEFGLASMRSERQRVAAHFPEQPWFLKFPDQIPDFYLAHLDKVRAWRGNLALKHIAPLAFIPIYRWDSLRKKVPEFAVVTSANRRALQFYAILNHADRCRAQAAGLPLKRNEWAEQLLLCALAIDAGAKIDSWAKEDYMKLRAKDGVAIAIEFLIGSNRLIYSIPKSMELLGKEDCIIIPALVN